MSANWLGAAVNGTATMSGTSPFVYAPRLVLRRLSFACGVAMLLAVGLLLGASASSASSTPVPVGDGPVEVAFSPDGTFAMVTNYYSGSVSRVRTSDGAVVASIPVGLVPIGVAISPDASFAYIANRDSNNVSRIRLTDNTVQATIPVPGLPFGVAISPDGAQAYVTSSDSTTVTRIRTSDNTVLGTVSVGSQPYPVKFSPDGSYAYVANFGSDTVSRIRTADATVQTTITVGDGPVGLDFAPDGSFAYVTNQTGGTVNRIRTSDNTVQATTTAQTKPVDVAISPDGTHAYVTNYGSGSVSELSTANNSVISTETGGSRPYGVAFSPNGLFAYVANFDSDSLWVLGDPSITVPGAPTGLVLTSGDTNATAAFTAPLNNGGSAITNYEYSVDNGVHWTTPSPAVTAPPLTITGLTNGVTYSTRLRAVNAAGPGPSSDPVTVTPHKVPGAPTNLSVEPGDRRAAVAFTTPPSDPEVKPVTNYEYSTNDGATWRARSPAATSTPFTIPNLMNGVGYRVRIRAVNADGPGAASAPVDVVPRTFPGAPTLVSAAPGNHQVVVTFGAPGDNGGAAIANYEYSTNDGATWNPRSPAATSTPFTITNLANAATYRIRIRAVNEAGSGPPSGALDVIPRTVPPAPVLLSVSPGNRQATLTFTGPSSNGGAAITNYEYSVNDGITWSPRTPVSVASPAVISGLINGTTYRVRLRAINAAGSGAASEALLVQPRTGSTPPVQVSGVPGDRQVRVVWRAPLDTGGLPVLGYRAVAQPSGRSCTTTGAATCVISGLNNGGWYRFIVAATTEIGTTDASAPSPVIIPRTVPSTPTSVLARAGYEQITVSWGGSSSSGGRPILGYRVASIDGSLSCAPGPTARSCVFRMVPGNRSYRFRVFARNEAGYSTPRLSSLVTTRFVPRPPTLAGWASTFTVMNNAAVGFGPNYSVPPGTSVTRVELEAIQDGRVVARGPTLGLRPGSYRLNQRVWYVMSNGQSGIAGWSQLIRINNYVPPPSYSYMRTRIGSWYMYTVFRFHGSGIKIATTGDGPGECFVGNAFVSTPGSAHWEGYLSSGPDSTRGAWAFLRIEAGVYSIRYYYPQTGTYAPDFARGGALFSPEPSLAYDLQRQVNNCY